MQTIKAGDRVLVRTMSSYCRIRRQAVDHVWPATIHHVIDATLIQVIDEDTGHQVVVKGEKCSKRSLSSEPNNERKTNGFV